MFRYFCSAYKRFSAIDPMKFNETDDRLGSISYMTVAESVEELKVDRVIYHHIKL